MTPTAFTWLTKQSVRHMDGFIVKSAGRFEMAYLEGNKKITIGVEDGRLPGGQHCVDIEPGSFLHWDGELTLISSVEQERIEQNFTAALKFMSIEVVKVDPGPGDRG